MNKLFILGCTFEALRILSPLEYLDNNFDSFLEKKESYLKYEMTLYPFETDPMNQTKGYIGRVLIYQSIDLETLEKIY